MVKRKLIDTNILIRFFTRDNEDQYEKVKKMFQSAKPGELVIKDLIIAEVVYVLESVYELPKEEIIEKIQGLVSFDKFALNRKVILKTLEVFKQNSVSFVDSYLCALNILGKVSSIYTFDKRLKKVEKVIAGVL